MLRLSLMQNVLPWENAESLKHSRNVGTDEGNEALRAGWSNFPRVGRGCGVQHREQRVFTAATLETNGGTLADAWGSLLNRHSTTLMRLKMTLSLEASGILEEGHLDDLGTHGAFLLRRRTSRNALPPPC